VFHDTAGRPVAIEVDTDQRRGAEVTLLPEQNLAVLRHPDTGQLRVEPLPGPSPTIFDGTQGTHGTIVGPSPTIP